MPSSDASATCFGETLASEVVVGEDRFGTGPERHLHCRWHVVFFRGVVISNHGTEKEEQSGVLPLQSTKTMLSPNMKVHELFL